MVVFSPPLSVRYSRRFFYVRLSLGTSQMEYSEGNTMKSMVLLYVTSNSLKKRLPWMSTYYIDSLVLNSSDAGTTPCPPPAPHTRRSDATQMPHAIYIGLTSSPAGPAKCMTCSSLGSATLLPYRHRCVRPWDQDLVFRALQNGSHRGMASNRAENTCTFFCCSATVTMCLRELSVALVPFPICVQEYGFIVRLRAVKACRRGACAARGQEGK